MTKQELNVDALMGAFAVSLRVETIHELLSGNDAGCFTTEQYQEQYQKSVNRSIPDVPLSLSLAHMHLERLPNLVHEVKPDVWAPVEVTRDLSP